MVYIAESWARRITNNVIVRVKVTVSQATGWLGLAATLRRGGLTLCAVTGLALCANSSATLPPLPPKPAPDPRAARLEQFFERYRCPSPQHVTEYLLAADDYGLDYRLLPALSIRETHCGIEETRNNRWGYHPGRQGFSSIEAGIDYVARQLAENPTYRGKSLRDKLFTYNPRPAYPREVQQIMLEIGLEETE
jgi:hypothetical protein